MNTPLEKALMTFKKNEMISFVVSHPEYFDEAVSLAVKNKQPYSWRSAFVLWGCITENDLRLKKHINKIVYSIRGKNDGHQRELIKILMKMELNEKQEAVLFDVCMNLWEQINKTPSIRHTAFKYIIKTVKKYPELQDEISCLLTSRYLDTLSPGVRNSISRLISEFHPKPIHP